VTDTVRWASQDLAEISTRRRVGGSTLAIGVVAAAGIGASAFLGIGCLKYERLVTADQVSSIHVAQANADLQDELSKLRDRLGAAEQALSTAQGRIANLNDETQHQPQSADQSSPSKADRLAQLTRSLEDAQKELHLAEAQRVTLLARLSKAEADVADGQQKQQQWQAGADQWQKKVQQLTSDRDKAQTERDQMKTRIEQLEQKLSARQTSRSVAQAQVPALPQPAQTLAMRAPAPQTPASQAATQPPVAQAQAEQPASAQTPAVQLPMAQLPTAQTPYAARSTQSLASAATQAASLVTSVPQAAAPSTVAAGEPVRQEAPPTVVAMAAPAAAPTVRAITVAAPAGLAPAIAPAVATGRSSGVAQFERVLASAGVDVAHLFAQFGANEGQGGPFIPAPRGSVPNDTLTSEKLAALSRLVKVLPVSAPLTNYEISSPFGVRGDPMNERASYHTGVDLRAPYDSPIYATAPGVVTFSGYRDDYGRVVEIDHGHGISTRYAHMHQAVVSVGQHVTAHQQIGYLGSSGRATGPHCHYEVLVNGEPQDPQKFMSLARLVPVSE